MAFDSEKRDDFLGKKWRTTAGAIICAKQVESRRMTAAERIGIRFLYVQ
jgi:hypothetical protein